MSNAANASVSDAAQNLSEQGVTLVNETSNWIMGNGLGVLIASSVGIAIALALLGVRSLGGKLLAREGADLQWRTIFARALARTNLFFIVLCSAELVAEHAATPPVLIGIIHFLFVIASAFQAAIWARELILGFIQHRVGAADETSNLGSAIGIIRLLVSIALFAIAIILILDNLGVNVTGLVAGLGIGGIAIGLAAQGIFSDLFAALSILFDKPFKKGDTIRYDQSTGTVERIGLKTTRLRSLTGEQLVMANTKLLEREIHNMAAARARRMTLNFAVATATPADKLTRIPELAGEAVAVQAGCKFTRCVAVGVGSGGIAFELVYDDKALDNNRMAQNRSAVLIGLIERLRSEKVEIVRASEIAPPLAPF